MPTPVSLKKCQFIRIEFKKYDRLTEISPN